MIADVRNERPLSNFGRNGLDPLGHALSAKSRRRPLEKSRPLELPVVMYYMCHGHGNVGPLYSGPTGPRFLGTVVRLT